jgi:hypothetical protein
MNYPTLADEEIVAIQWSVSGPFYKAMTSDQYTALSNLLDKAAVLNNDADPAKQVDAALIAAAEALREKKQNEMKEQTM